MITLHGFGYRPRTVAEAEANLVSTAKATCESVGGRWDPTVGHWGPGGKLAGTCIPPSAKDDCEKNHGGRWDEASGRCVGGGARGASNVHAAIFGIPLMAILAAGGISLAYFFLRKRR